MSNRSCIFCEIARGERTCYKVFEDSSTLAFLDVYPLAAGHTLIIPKVHKVRLGELSAEEGRALFETLMRIVEPVQRAVGAHACTIGVNDGRESGQVVPHVHIHIIPRFKGDGGGTIHSIISRRPDIDSGQLESIAGKIRQEL